LIIILIFTAKSIICHDIIIFICIFITHFIIADADVCIVESTFCFTNESKILLLKHGSRW
jgi:hypothetical protein